MHTYSDGKKIYSVDLMLAYINIFKPRPILVNIVDHIYTLNVKGWGDPTGKNFYSAADVLSDKKKYKKDYAAITEADMKYPIIITRGDVADGIHRLAKAYMLGKSTIKAYDLTSIEEHFLLDKNYNWAKVHSMTILDYILHFEKIRKYLKKK